MAGSPTDDDILLPLLGDVSPPAHIDDPLAKLWCSVILRAWRDYTARPPTLLTLLNHQSSYRSAEAFFQDETFDLLCGAMPALEPLQEYLKEFVRARVEYRNRVEASLPPSEWVQLQMEIARSNRRARSNSAQARASRAPVPDCPVPAFRGAEGTGEEGSDEADDCA